MHTQIQLSDIVVDVVKKDIKNVHLSVYPPSGRVLITAPARMSLDVIRVFAISKLRWIRSQQNKLEKQVRETSREYIDRESHYLWGLRCLMTVRYQNVKPKVTLHHRQILLIVRPESSTKKRAKIIHEWHKYLLHEVIPALIQKWEKKLNVRVNRYFLQQMKTKWGSCNHLSGNIRLNTELVKKPKELLEYIIVHEMVHLIEPTHGPRFSALLDQHYPRWREARSELNELPLRTEIWKTGTYT